MPPWMKWWNPFFISFIYKKPSTKKMKTTKKKKPRDKKWKRNHNILSLLKGLHFFFPKVELTSIKKEGLEWKWRKQCTECFIWSTIAHDNKLSKVQWSFRLIIFTFPLFFIFSWMSLATSLMNSETQQFAGQLNLFYGNSAEFSAVLLFF